jgi:hypothetical protein
METRLPILAGQLTKQEEQEVLYAHLPRVWSQIYEQVVDDEQLPSYNQEQIILERMAGCKYHYNQ